MRCQNRPKLRKRMDYKPVSDLMVIARGSCAPFAEDTDGRIFKSRWRDRIPDTWVTQLPMFTKELFDIDDNGKSDDIYVMELYQMILL